MALGIVILSALRTMRFHLSLLLPVLTLSNGLACLGSTGYHGLQFFCQHDLNGRLLHAGFGLQVFPWFGCCKSFCDALISQNRNQVVGSSMRPSRCYPMFLNQSLQFHDMLVLHDSFKLERKCQRLGRTVQFKFFSHCDCLDDGHWGGNTSGCISLKPCKSLKTTIIWEMRLTSSTCHSTLPKPMMHGSVCRIPRPTLVEWMVRFMSVA